MSVSVYERTLLVEAELVKGEARGLVAHHFVYDRRPAVVQHERVVERFAQRLQREVHLRVAHCEPLSGHCTQRESPEALVQPRQRRDRIV